MFNHLIRFAWICCCIGAYLAGCDQHVVAEPADELLEDHELPPDVEDHELPPDAEDQDTADHAADGTWACPGSLWPLAADELLFEFRIGCVDYRAVVSYGGMSLDLCNRCEEDFLLAFYPHSEWLINPAECTLDVNCGFRVGCALDITYAVRDQQGRELPANCQRSSYCPCTAEKRATATITPVVLAGGAQKALNLLQPIGVTYPELLAESEWLLCGEPSLVAAPISLGDARYDIVLYLPRLWPADTPVELLRPERQRPLACAQAGLYEFACIPDIPEYQAIDNPLDWFPLSPDELNPYVIKDVDLAKLWPGFAAP